MPDIQIPDQLDKPIEALKVELSSAVLFRQIPQNKARGAGRGPRFRGAEGMGAFGGADGKILVQNGFQRSALPLQKQVTAMVGAARRRFDEPGERVRLF